MAFAAVMGALLLGTSWGRAVLAAPVDVGIPVPRWVVWGVALLGYSASKVLTLRSVRVAVAFTLMHAFIPAQVANPLPWSLVQELGLFALVLLLDLHHFPSQPGGPDRPRHWPASAVRQTAFTFAEAINERRRLRRSR